MDTTYLIAIGCVVIYVVHWIVKWRTLPPGPLGLPLVGYLPFMSSKPYLILQKLKKKYGPVFSLRLGSVNVVVLNDFASIRKAFAQDAFMGRSPESPFHLSKDNIETGAFNGMAWKEQRRVCLQMLRDVGFGKTKMEEHIKEEIADLLDRFEASNGEAIVPSILLTPSMSNNIASLVFGHRMTYDDPKRVKLDFLLNSIGKLAGQVSWQLFFPTVGKILTFLHLGAGRKMDKIVEQMHAFLWKEIIEHENTLDTNNVRDFIDGYLLEIKKRPNDPSFKKTILMDLVGAFFGAGSETVRITVDWLMLTMAAHPDVQKRVQAEIDDVIGRERFPTGADRMSMPFTEAVLLEVMRWITIVPINPLRYTLEESEINGYTIPKHWTILANLWGVHHDTDLWGGDAALFRPDRFLTEDGKVLKKIDHFIPFSSGKRACPGESLARVECFLYFAAILQKFDLRLPDGKVPDFEGILGIGLQPKRQQLHVVKRQ